MNTALIDFMKLTLLDNQVKSEFEKNFGKIHVESDDKRLEYFRSPDCQYTIKKNYSNWSFQYQIGYFNINKSVKIEYLNIGAVVGIKDNYKKKPKNYSSQGYMKLIESNENSDNWILRRYDERQWTAIFYTKKFSIQDFLSPENHVIDMKEHFLDCIVKMKSISTRYF